MGWRTTRFTLLCLTGLAIACGSEHRVESRRTFEAPVASRATLLLAPDLLHVGEIVTAEIVVVTPPESQVRNIPLQPVEGLALIDTQTLPSERSEHHWKHRLRLRFRADAVGAHVWPGLELEVQHPDGSLQPVALAERRFEVASMRGLFPERDQPFGLEEPAAEDNAASFGGFVAGLALGVLLAALLALGAIAIRTLLRRRRLRRHRIPESQPTIGLFEWTEREIADALELVATHPRQSASRGARLLRIYMARRFGSDTEASTTEELERRTPALAEQRLWPDFVRILHGFDDERFRPPDEGPGAQGSARTRSALEATRQLIGASRPTGPSNDT